MRSSWTGLILMLALVGSASAQTVVLNQPPNQTDAVLSDFKLQSFPLLPVPTGATAADNFTLAEAGTIARITVWGIYVGAPNIPDTDRFSVIFHTDDVASPGTVLASRAGVSVTRSATGEVLNGDRAEYQYILQFDPVVLDSGTYWVEVANDTTGADASFYWSFGTLDPVAGVMGAVSRLTAITGADWQLIELDPMSGSEVMPDLAIEIETLAAVKPVPALAGWWLAMLAWMLASVAIWNVRSSPSDSWTAQFRDWNG